MIMVFWLLEWRNKSEDPGPARLGIEWTAGTRGRGDRTGSGPRQRRGQARWRPLARGWPG
jgi:hypothetical protein